MTLKQEYIEREVILESNCCGKMSGVCLFVCLFTHSLRAEAHLGPDGTRLEQNVQGRL